MAREEQKTKRGFITVLVRESGRIASNPLYAIFTFVVPLAVFALLCTIFHEGVPRELPLLVYDADQSSFSRQLIRMLDASSTIRVVPAPSGIEEGRRLVLSGRGYAFIVIPENLEENILTGRPSEVIEYYNNQFLLPASLVDRDVKKAVATLSGGVELRLRQKYGETREAALAHLQPILIDSHALFNPQLNYVYFLVNTLLPTMLQIFILMVSVYALGIELKDGTAGEWFDAAGGNTLKAVAGKLLPHTLCFLCIGFFMNTLLFRFLGVPLRGSIVIIMLSTALLVCAYQSLALFFVAVTANMRLALSFSAFYAAPAFAFVGITFPTIGMPLAGKIWGSLLPLSHYLSILVDQSLRGAPVSMSLPSIAVLTAFALIPSAAVMWRFKKLMTVNTYWGRS